MRTSILSAFLLGIIVASIPLFASADDTLSGSKDIQFEPKSYTTPTPPLHSPAPRVHEVQVKPEPKVEAPKPISRKPVPLEVRRTQAKMKSHIVVKHHPYPCEYHHKHIVQHHRPRRPRVHHFVAPKRNVLFANLRKHHHLSHCVVYPGSLRVNVERIAGQYGWRHVVWSLPEDYRWVGKTRIAARGLSGILGKLLQDYPLQAQFYEGNHVLVIIPRTIQ